MGTRHLTCVVLDQSYKIAQYGQWDGYPKGQGLTTLRFLRDKMVPSFRDKVRAVREIEEDVLLKRWQMEGAKGEFVSIDVAEKFKKKYPELSRDTGAEILELVQNAPPGLLLRSDLGFVADSLFCEWCWVIDLDKNTFEAYKGFNKEPLGPRARFKSFDSEGSEYRPVKKVAQWKLNALPTEEQFLAKFTDE